MLRYQEESNDQDKSDKVIVNELIDYIQIESNNLNDLLMKMEAEYMRDE